MFLPLMIHDARTFSLGNPRLVLVSGPAAVSVNPTRISSPRPSLYASHNFWLLGTRKEHLAVSSSISIVDYGLSVEYFDYGDLEHYPDYPSEDPSGKFPAFDFFMTPGLSIKIPNGHLGFNISYLYELIFDQSYSTYCIDLVLDYEPHPDLDLIIGLTDFNPGIVKDTSRYFPPVVLGGGVELRLKVLSIAGEVGYLIHSEDMIGSVGVEYRYHPILFRAGLFYLDRVIPTLGIGYVYKNITIDLGLAQHSYNLGRTEHLGLGIRF
ncbi:MAG TPA: hypothetical protein EYP24_04400 [bacterium (Candidatus Stahlbacteria)]|nr:hypothetical protein [Candidatus Stahlbacteria bacterium]